VLAVKCSSSLTIY